MAHTWETYLNEVRKAGSSAGAVIEVVAEGVPPGLGAPIYGKLDADIAAALMSINAVKGVEIGDGFAAAGLSGEANADEMRMHDGRVVFESNHAGVFWVAFPPANRSWHGSRSNRPARSWRRAPRSIDPAMRSQSPPRAVTTPASASARSR